MNMNVGLWIAQVLLAAAFGMAGVMKITAPIAELTQSMVWPGDVPTALVRVIGAAELLGAIGLIVPAATRIMPVLTPLAACGLVTVMFLATVFHVTRGEYSALPINLLLGGLAAFVAWGRWRRAPITPR